MTDTQTKVDPKVVQKNVAMWQRTKRRRAAAIERHSFERSFNSVLDAIKRKVVNT